MSATKKAVFLPFPLQLDTGPLRSFLVEQKVDSIRADDMVAAAKLLVARYGAEDKTSDWPALRINLEEIAKAASKLAEAIRPRTTLDEAWSAIADAYATNAEGVRTDPDAHNKFRLERQWRDRIGHRSQFLANISLLRDAANEAIDRRKQPGAPIKTKTKLSEELAILWRYGTEERPKATTATTWKEPRTIFAEFVKLAVQMLPSTMEFETGFANTLMRAIEATEERQ